MSGAWQVWDVHVGADVVRDIRLPHSPLLGGEGRLEREHVPCWLGIRGEVHGVAVLGPWPGRERRRGRVLLHIAAHTLKREAAPAPGIGLGGIAGIDPGVRRDTGGRDITAIAAPARPQYVGTLVGELLLQGEVRGQLRWVAPVEHSAVLDEDAVAFRQRSTGNSLGLGKPGIIDADARMDVNHGLQALLLGPAEKPRWV